MHLRSFLLIDVVLFVVQVRDKCVEAMRMSHPRVRMVFVYRFNSEFHSTFILQVGGSEFQHGPNLSVPMNPSFRVRYFFILAKCVHDKLLVL